MNVEELLGLPEDQFRKLVDSEVRRNSNEPNPKLEELAEALRDHRVAPIWRVALISMKKSVEGQLGAKRMDLARAEAELAPEMYTKRVNEFHVWRAGALRFRNGVEERILELSETQTRTVAMLRSAIIKHKQTVTREYDDDVSEADVALWSLVE